MALNFQELRKNRNESFKKLMDKVQQDTHGSHVPDPRYWKPTIDGEGNGSAILRFLPAPEGEDFPFIKYFNYSFKGATGRYYNHLALSTIGQKDPVGELNSELWNSSEDDKSQARMMARAQSRKTNYVSNVLIVRDPGNPANEGKVFLYRYPKTIFGKLDDKMHPKYEDETPMNPFDPWSGANFKLRIKKVAGFRNYDDSAFDAPSQIASDDAAIEAIWKMAYPLQAEISADKFESYDTLKANLREVIGNTADLILKRSVLGDSELTARLGEKTAEPTPAATRFKADKVAEAAAMSISDDDPPFDVGIHTPSSKVDPKPEKEAVDDVMAWLNNIQ